jgi:predicted thioesterase
MSSRAGLVVSRQDTAIAVGSGDVPVLATPRLLALCEEASVAAVALALSPGETTVGARIELDHLAPSPIGASVVADAVLESVEGRVLTFRVCAVQDGREVGRGTVKRVVVDRERFGARGGGAAAASVPEPASPGEHEGDSSL